MLNKEQEAHFRLFGYACAPGTFDELEIKHITAPRRSQRRKSATSSWTLQNEPWVEPVRTGYSDSSL